LIEDMAEIDHQPLIIDDRPDRRRAHERFLPLRHQPENNKVHGRLADASDAKP
jgi:hypothetical protein